MGLFVLGLLLNSPCIATEWLGWWFSGVLGVSFVDWGVGASGLRFLGDSLTVDGCVYASALDRWDLGTSSM